MPAVLNASNEVAVEAFCEDRLSFGGIAETVARVLDQHEAKKRPELEEILEADLWARRAAKKAVAARPVLC